MATKKPIKNNAGTLTEFGASDTIPPENLATGTPTGSKYLRDDGTWAALPGGATYNVLAYAARHS